MGAPLTGLCQSPKTVGQNYEAVPNWIGGGATRPITQAWIQYSIFARSWVNSLDGLWTNKAEESFVNRRLQTETWWPRITDGLLGRSLTVDNSFPIIHLLVGAWLSLVERSVRDREVGGSNPLAPTNNIKNLRLPALAAVLVVWEICDQSSENSRFSEVARHECIASWSSDPCGPSASLLLKARIQLRRDECARVALNNSLSLHCAELGRRDE